MYKAAIITLAMFLYIKILNYISKDWELFFGNKWLPKTLKIAFIILTLIRLVSISWG